MRNKLWISLFVLLFACKQEEYIPNVWVDYDLNLTLPQYADLQIVGNYVFVQNEGVKGLIVYRQDFEVYKTYDRCCSFEPTLSCAKIDSVNSPIAICTCCGSKFLLNEEGSAIGSPAILPLKQYNNVLEGDFLRIFN